MAASPIAEAGASAASQILGRKLDSIPFTPYHLMIIAVLGLTGFVNGQYFGESFGPIFSGVLAPFLMAPDVGSATIFFGTIFVVVAIGAFVPVGCGRETIGQLESVTEAVPEPA